MPRVFIALPIDDAVRALAAEAVAAIDAFSAQAAGSPRLARTSGDRLHVTLAFLGEIEVDRLEDVFAITARVARRHEEMIAEAGGMGAFPRSNAARVLWLGFDDGGGSLRALVASLVTDLRAAGFALDERPFTGHVTLARVRDRRPLDARAVLARGPERRVTCRVAELVVMESRRAPQESEYVALFRARLASGARSESV